MSLNVPTPPVTVGTVAPPVSVAVPSFGVSLFNPFLMSAVLLSFGGQRYTPKTANSFGEEYDYIIVGAGSAGSVVASRLSEVACVSVLLLEAGKQPPPLTDVPGLAGIFRNTGVDWSYKTSPQKYSAYAMDKQQIYFPMGKALGGTSVLNAMLYTRGNSRDYDNWAAAGAQGWSYNDVLPYFIKAEDNQNSSYLASAYHGKGGPLTVHRPWWESDLKLPVMRAAKYLGYKFVDVNGPRQTGFFDFQATMRSGQRCSTGKAYLVPAEDRTNLRIVAKAMVRKVIIRNKRAVGVEVDYRGQTRVVRARREVIVSAGTVKTAQLLMLSGIGPKEHLKKHNIPIVEDLPVGENFHDHCGTVLFFENKNPTVQSPFVELTSPASVAQYAAKRSGPLASSLLTFLTAFLKNNETEPMEDFPSHQLYKAEGSVKYLLRLGIKQDVYAKTFASYSRRNMLICGSSILQPKSRGRITLKSSDPYDVPIINPNYYKHPDDVKDVVDGLKTCIRLCTSPPLKRFGIVPLKTLLSGCEQYANDTDKYLECYTRSLVLITSHEVGTARMGDPNDPTTVVDPLLRYDYHSHFVSNGLPRNNIKFCNRMIKRFGIVPLKTVLSGCQQYANDTDKYLGCYTRSLVFTTSHEVGTARMGDPNDPTTVVDLLFRVKNIDGLRIVDCSVMPIVISGNTNAPAIMVAEKASDIIKSTIDCNR